MFNEVMESIHKWFGQLQKPEYSAIIKTRVITDGGDSFHACLETAGFVAVLVVHQPDFAPYRWVCFEIKAADGAAEAPVVYSYCDGSSHTVTHIISRLNKGIDIMLGR